LSRRTITVVIVVVAVASLFVWRYATPTPFRLLVTRRPASPPGTDEADVMAVAEQRCVFLVVIEDEENWLQGSKGLGEPVDISATSAEKMASVTVYPQSIEAGRIADVTVVPSQASINETLHITITGARHGLVQTEKVAIKVIPGEDTLGFYAAKTRDKFISWLAENHSELGITNGTKWTGTIVNPRILVVMHYIFFSDEWEIYLTWHVMIPPHDWARMYLRRRFAELRPSYAFEISSVSAQSEPYAIAVPDWA